MNQTIVHIFIKKNLKIYLLHYYSISIKTVLIIYNLYKFFLNFTQILSTQY